MTTTQADGILCEQINVFNISISNSLLYGHVFQSDTKYNKKCHYRHRLVDRTAGVPSEATNQYTLESNSNIRDLPLLSCPQHYAVDDVFRDDTSDKLLRIQRIAKLLDTIENNKHSNSKSSQCLNLGEVRFSNVKKLSRSQSLKAHSSKLFQKPRVIEPKEFHFENSTLCANETIGNI